MTELEFAERFPVDETIPQTILGKIIDIENRLFSWTAPRWRYYPYYELQNGMLAIATVGVKSKKDRSGNVVGRYTKKFTVHVIGREYAYARDIDLKGLAGYIPEFNGLKKHRGESNIVNDYISKQWYCVHSNLFRLYNNHDMLNPEFLEELDEFKYCAFDGTTDAFDYLSAYTVCPQMELISKLLTSNYAASVRVIKKAAKDKKFISWLKANRAEIISKAPSIPDLIKAYNRKWTIDRAMCDSKVKAYFRRVKTSDAYVDEFQERERSTLIHLYRRADKAEREKMIAYMVRNDIRPQSYNDYLVAVNALGLDIHDTKNVYPENYQYWHDMRMDQYRASMDEIDKHRQQKLSEQINAVADKYTALTKSAAGALVVVIARSKDDLLREGEILHHCVGRMNYDSRILREQSLIFFVRHSDSVDKPFVTVEFSLTNGQVLQCYGDHDSLPDLETRRFVYEEWQPRAKRELDKIKQQAAEIETIAI